MPLAVRRVGGSALGSQPYTLGPSEAFRLDSASFTVTAAEDGDFVIPSLLVTDPSGSVIAELVGTAANAPARATTNGFAYTGPAAFVDDDFQRVPRGYVGYALHDFGAVPVTSQVTRTWTQIGGLAAQNTIEWLKSPGAVTMGADIGAGAVSGATTLTLTLFGSVSAGDYLLIHIAVMSTVDFDPFGMGHLVTVTDNVGGNVLDYGVGHPDLGFAPTRTAAPGGGYIVSWVDFYRIVNPLGVGARVTVTVPISSVTWLGVQANPITGLTVGSPIGPNPGGNYEALVTTMLSSPSTTTVVIAGVPKFVGPVLMNSAYPLPLAGDLDVQLGRGLYDTAFVTTIPAAGSSVYSQTRISELHVAAQDTVTAVVRDDTGRIREGDVISDFLLYGVDDE